MKNIDERMREVLKSIKETTSELSLKTGIKYDRWTTGRKENGRFRAEEVEAICKLYPQFQMWIATGSVMPEAGQISPELEEIRDDLSRTGTDTE